MLLIVFTFTFAFFILTTNYFNIDLETFIVAKSEGVSDVEINASVSDVLEEIDFSELENIIHENPYFEEIFDGDDLKTIIKRIVAGEVVLSFDTLWNVVLQYLKEVFFQILSPLLVVLVIILLCNVFNNLKSKSISGVGNVVYLICLSVVLIILIYLSANIINSTKNTLLKMQSHMRTIFPILITLMSLMGGNASVKAYTPMFTFLSNTIMYVFIYVLLPLFLASFILVVIGNLSENAKLTKLNLFINSLFKWVVGSVFAVFMSFMAINGISAAAGDGVSIKAAKYAIKNYVPMLGGYISEGFELIKAGGLLVKNATGVISVVFIILNIFSPIVSIALLELGLKFLAGIVEPVGDKRSSTVLFGVANSLKLLVVIIVGVSLMFFLTIFLVMCSVSNFL